MRILIFTTVFTPSIGGIERLAALLAREFAVLGHEVTVATLTPGADISSVPYRISRAPSTGHFIDMLRRCDVNLHFNLSLKHLHPIPLRTPLVVSHQTEYTRPSGHRGFRDRLKVALARRLNGIACSRYIARRVGCRTVVENAYDDALFRRTERLDQRTGDVVFLGRLVTEKGCDLLLDALALTAGRIPEPSCTIIGNGPERGRLADLVTRLGLRRVHFAGPLQGEELVAELNRHRILAAPSRYAEPFGIVALEGLACGCLPIVSRAGGLTEAIGSHGLVFDNGEAQGLSDQIVEAVSQPRLADQLLGRVEDHLAHFVAPRVAARYLEVLKGAAAA